MSNPAYLFLTDENGSPMVGPCLVSGREGAIELKSFTHNVNIPVNGNTGKLTGTRIHMPVMFQKEFDRVTPVLFRALSTGRTLQSATIKMYQINEAGLGRVRISTLRNENETFSQLNSITYIGVFCVW
ncbi:TPA: type VI secretion system tube protein Hcp [Enterobacter asburiae]|nr:type VI secretion system tube protein Hcp [Enterobacter asburiae]